MEQEKSLEEKTSAVKSLEELDKIEQEINANDKGGQQQPKDPDKKETDNPDKKPVEPKNNDKNKEPEDKGNKDKNEKTVITDELRKKLNIPEKFKYMEDVVVWGAESEKLITKAANEKKEILKEKEQAVSEREVYKQEIAKLKEELKKANEKEPTISKEEKQKMIDEFNELFVEDPIKAITKVMQKINEMKKEAQPPEQKPNENKDKEKQEQEELEKMKKEFHERATKEWEDISKDLNDEQKKELLAGLNKIAQEKPYILSLYDLKDIYDIRKQREESKLKQEEEKKKKERMSQSSPQSSAEVIREDKIKTINSAKSLKDLDEAEKKL